MTRNWSLLLAGVLIGNVVLLGLFYPEALGNFTMLFLLMAMGLGAVSLRNENEK